MDRDETTKILREEAFNLGFSYVGISSAERLDAEEHRLREWLNRGYQGSMDYLENHFSKRLDPRELVPGAKSVVSLLYNYYTPERQKDQKAPKISMYAFGKDYHRVIRKKLKVLLRTLNEKIGPVQGRAFVDSAPVMEREWARRSGVGWVGKNTLLINPRSGSYFFLAELVVDIELEAGEPISDHCGTCRKCIDACPTDAIHPEGYVLDARKCISYLTIEHREAIPDEFEGKMEDWVFGCDICQEVCPWNRFSEPHDEPKFGPNSELLEMNASQWHDLDEETFDGIFEGSAVKRTKFKGLKRNIEFLNSRP